MWWLKERSWARYEFTFCLWSWAIPLFIDKDYGQFSIQVLCCKITIYEGWTKAFKGNINKGG